MDESGEPDLLERILDVGTDAPVFLRLGRREVFLLRDDA